MNDSTNIPTNTHLASPLKKQTAQGKMHSTKYDQVDDISLGYSSFELQAMLENFELDGERNAATRPPRLRSAHFLSMY